MPLDESSIDYLQANLHILTQRAITIDEFEKNWRINALGALLVSRQVIPAMKANKRGNINFIGATASHRGGAKTAAFAPAKAAQRSLAESIARHLGSAGIRVVTVSGDSDILLSGKRNT
jgi:NAD(P)-dependent dehydrogenase (short-subunit alcohol dehydrogenase family)